MIQRTASREFWHILTRHGMERKMMQPPYGSEDAFRSRLAAARLWSYGALGTWEALARAARRSGEEARAVRESSRATPDGAYLARAGDLARAQWFLWA